MLSMSILPRLLGLPRMQILPRLPKVSRDMAGIKDIGAIAGWEGEIAWRNWKDCGIAGRECRDCRDCRPLQRCPYHQECRLRLLISSILPRLPNLPRLPAKNAETSGVAEIAEIADPDCNGDCRPTLRRLLRMQMMPILPRVSPEIAVISDIASREWEIACSDWKIAGRDCWGCQFF